MGASLVWHSRCNSAETWPTHTHQGDSHEEDGCYLGSEGSVGGQGGRLQGVNHSRAGLKVRSAVKAGGFKLAAVGNHNRAGLKVRSAVKAGGLRGVNHNRIALKAGL